MSNQKVTDEQIISVLGEGTREQQAASLGLTLRGYQRRLARMIEDGKINSDKSVKGDFPGIGREIVKVSTKLDSRGRITGQNITEKPSVGDHEPVIDAPIIRQSRLTDRDGTVRAQWDIRVPRKTQEAEQALVDGFTASLKRLPPQPLVVFNREETLVNQYTFSDVHVGLMVDEEFASDLPATEDLIAQTFEKMVASAPKAETAVISILGDWFHFDSLLPVTPTSNNILFSNSHYHDMVQSAIKIMRKLITAALYAHREVTVVISEGNHDIVSSYWLRQMFMALYEHEPRVKFIDKDDPFYGMQLGKLFLGFHHGHVKTVKKPEDLTLLMATDFAKMWGETEHRYIHTGHLHHFIEKEVSGATVVQHPTLAGKDNHSRRGGYRSGRAAICHTYSKLLGRVGTTTVTPEMLMR